MDYAAALQRVYDHLENGHVANAVMTCLRIARHLQDYLHAAIFLREMYPVTPEFTRVLYEDTRHLKEDVRKYLEKKSLELWLEAHTLDYSLGCNEYGEARNVLAIAVGELDPELDQWERCIQDIAVPSGMHPFDTAAFTARHSRNQSPAGGSVGRTSRFASWFSNQLWAAPGARGR